MKHYFFHRILISRFSFVDNLLHLNLAYFPVNIIKQFVFLFLVSLLNFIIKIPIILLVFYQEYCISYTEVLIFYADQLMLMGNSKNSCVFNFAILLKSRKFDPREIYMFYST